VTAWSAKSPRPTVKSTSWFGTFMTSRTRSGKSSRARCDRACYLPLQTVEDTKVPSDPVEFALFRYVKLRHGDNAASPFGWNRFYRFAVLAHARRKGWDACDVKARMLRYGLPEKKAEEMAEVYWHCRCALRLKSRRTEHLAYHKWMRKGGTRST